ncbi:MAG: efflux RND transporter periplasmic adaptor subunit [Marinobacterium sp.]|nr:efflux RND transporter periplasmic adaptor subunit [Marinobacterium sp.]
MTTPISQSDTDAIPSGADATLPRPARRWPWLLLALLLLFTVIGWLLEAEDSIDIEEYTASHSPSVLPVVSIESRQVESATLRVQAFAELKPRWAIEIQAAVSGRVTDVSPLALSGSEVEQGAPLLQLEDTPYRAELAQAELNLADAHRQLLRAESETAVARRQYRNRGDDQANALALRLPELEVARQAVKAAQAQQAAARLKLNDSQVRAPFAGFVTRRLVSPGQRVAVGDPLLSLADNRTLELTVELSPADWQKLAQPVSGQQAQLSNSQGKSLGTATVRQGGGFLDSSSRQYQLFLQVENADQRQLLAGDFVHVSLVGIKQPRTLNIPASAITQSGQLWYLDTNNRLRNLSPMILFRHQQRVVIRAPEGASQWRIATTPLAAFLPGQPVQPHLTDAEE